MTFLTSAMRSIFAAKRGRQGFTLIYAVLVTSLLLAVVLKLYSVVVKEQLLSSATKTSEVSFYAANSGLECAMYADLHAPTDQFSFYQPGLPTVPIFPVSCDGVVETVNGTGIDSTNAVWQAICQPLGLTTSQCAASQFTAVFESSCAVVSVAKINATGGSQYQTRIEARGYNTTQCPGSGPTVAERAIRTQYGSGGYTANPSSYVAGRYIFYNNSSWDGNNPAANSADDGAIAPDKQALLPGQTATFANYTSYARGINGIMVDIPATNGVSVNDFQFKVGNDSNPSAWSAAPAPSSVTVRTGAGINGADRITIIWADNAIQKQWLQVTVLADAATRLPTKDVFYFGNAIGETGNSTTDAIVDLNDVLAIRANHGVATITSPFDINRDGTVDTTDENIANSNQTLSFNALQLITAPAQPGFVAGRYIFYNNSSWDGNNPAANSADDGAIAPDKQALLPGQTATFANYTSYARGINGIMVDIPATNGVSVNDFQFKVGNDSNPSAWSAAPAPSSVTVRTGAGVGQSDRITIIWSDNTIQKEWLQVTVLATQATGLYSNTTFYFGNAIGETGNSTANAIVDSSDENAILNNLMTGVSITNVFDMDRDGSVLTNDALIAGNNFTSASTALQLISP